MAISCAAPPAHTTSVRHRRPLAPGTLSAAFPNMGRRSVHLSEFPEVGLSRPDARAAQLPGGSAVVSVGRIDLAALVRRLGILDASVTKIGRDGIVGFVLAAGAGDAAAFGADDSGGCP